MKKFFGLMAVALVSIFALASCSSKPLESTKNDYYATGAWNGWDAIDEGKMVAASLSDSKLKSIKKALKEAEVTTLYMFEVELPPDKLGVDGAKEGQVCVKVIRTAKDDKDTIDFWAQAKESGKITNLTPDTLYIPEYRETDTAGDGLGTWADNSAAIGAGKVIIVFAEGPAGYKAMGIIKVA